MDKLKAVLSIAKTQQTTLGFGLVALLTAGGEQVFSAVVFRCPCSSWNFAYGTVFLLVPALVLLILGYILSNKTWKMFTGLCFRKRTPFRLRNTCVFLKMFMQISTTAMVAPVSWIAVALLNGIYFECARTGLNSTLFQDYLCLGKAPQCQSELHRFPCGKSSVPEKEDVLATIRAESQVLGWLLIASIMTAALLLTCVARCRSPISYVQLKFWQVYAQKESDLLDRYAAEHAQNLAERNLTSFFQQKPPEETQTQTRGYSENVVYFSPRFKAR
ncbi:calcium homeostasis modulator protein 6 isoform X3 [Conger conger]|uniref:calcium homeostasis modulator protein 6 isoform X3 n=1 Tax=Conger conger TaxID=82655 RepID=UPI002A599F94|nr:calcium homeostasis modulator protein 6 isoform X3 [Conger conger]